MCLPRKASASFISVTNNLFDINQLQFHLQMPININYTQVDNKLNIIIVYVYGILSEIH